MSKSNDHSEETPDRKATERPEDSCSRAPSVPISLETALPTTQPRDVPVFNCVVYVRKTDSGAVLRVANLAGITEEASSERAGLAAVVSRFKQMTAEYLQGDGTIPWIEPIPDPEPDEQSRFIPVHL